MKGIARVLLLGAFALSVAIGGEKLDKRKGVAVELPLQDLTKYTSSVSPPAFSAIGTSTTITGFWDFQINGGACEMIRVNPANGNIHVIMMVADDSANQSTSRRTAYAMSTNNGLAWNNFSNLRVPSRRSGYPFLDLGKGPISGGVIIGNHSVIPPQTAELQSTVFVDYPEGSGAFAEVGAPPLIAGTDEPVWPATAGASDGSIVMAPGRLTAATSHITRTTDYLSWAPWFSFPGTDLGSARNVAVANNTNRVAVVQNAGGLSYVESTNNGATWPSTPTVIHPIQRIVGSDTFGVANASDAVYNGNNLLAAIEVTNQGANEPTDQAQIWFWSAATALRLAVPHDTSRFITTLATAQTFHSTLGYPVIGLSGDTIVIVFAAFQRDLSPANFNFSDLWWTKSTDGGLNWTVARNLTNTPAVDERYPSISKWNPPGFANIVWQEKLDPGSSVRAERPVTRASQKFLRFSISTSTGVNNDRRSPAVFSLGQNYPNPFNPSTIIQYSLPREAVTTLKVYNSLGQEVATLVNQTVRPGQYEVSFDGSTLPSGVYMYTMHSGGYSESKKMVLMK